MPHHSLDKATHHCVNTITFHILSNQKAVIDMTYIAVDYVRKDKGRNGGTIVNVASGAGKNILRVL